MSKKGSGEEPDPVIVGYEYSLAFQLVFALAGIVAMRALRIGDKSIVWTGNSGGGTITIDKPELYGGKKNAGQGGFVANVDILTGGPSQSRPYLLPLSGGNVNYCPHYRDRFSLVFRRGSGGAYVGNSGSIDSISGIFTGADYDYFINGVASWQPSTRWIQATDNSYPDINPIHILRDLIIGDDIGLGANEADIDDAVFAAAAQDLYDEGFGVSMLFSGGESAEDYITEVCRHINALVYQDQEDGLYKVKLLRDDYDADEAIGGATFPILFNEDNCKLKSFSRIGTGEQVNRVVVSYYNVSKNDTDTIMAYDLALNDELGGAPVTKEVRYEGVTSRILAEKLAYRDLREQSTPLARVQIECSRVASYLRTGDVFKWSNDELGIQEMILRVMKISYGTVRNGTIIIDAIEDIFGYGETIYLGDNYDGHTDQVGDPELIDNWQVFEVPYYLYIKQTGSLPTALGTTGGTAMVVAIKQTATDRSFYTFYDSQTAGYLPAQRVGGFAQGGELCFAVTKTDHEILSYIDEPQYVQTGYALLVTDGVNHEIMEIQTLDLSDSPELDNGYRMGVKRGCADTVPQEWNAGDMVYIFERGYGLAANNWEVSDSIGFKLYASNAQGTYPTDESPQPDVKTLLFAQRAQKPYPPGRMQINSEFFPAHLDASPDQIAVTWDHRNRVSQGGDLYGFTEDLLVTLPANCEYVLRFQMPTAPYTVWREEVTTSTASTWTEADQIADVGSRPNSVEVVLFTRDTSTGLESDRIRHIVTQ